VTNIEETKPQIKRRFPIPDMAGKVKILGDIVSPIVYEIALAQNRKWSSLSIS
jgi:hypothetical protein